MDWSSDVCSSDLSWPLLWQEAGADPSPFVTLNLFGDHYFDIRNFVIASAAKQSRAVYAPLDCFAALAMTRSGLFRSRSLSRSRSEERRGGKEFVNTCRSRWSPYH